MATHYEVFKLFKGIAADMSETVNTFLCGPGEFFNVNPRDKTFPCIYMEEEQLGSPSNARDRRTVAFWVLDRTFTDAADMDDEAAKCLSKCEQIGRMFLAKLAHLEPNAIPEPFDYSTAAVPIGGADRCYGYRFEIVLDFSYELNTCV